MKKSALEKFIQSYVRNKQIRESREGYEAWLRKNGVDPTASFSKSAGDAYADHERTKTKSSELYESLAENGAVGSGYAKYLYEAERKKRDSRIGSAMKTYIDTDTKNRSAYSGELEKLEEARISEEKKAEDAAKKAIDDAAKAALKKEAEILKSEETIKNKLMKDAETGIRSMSTIDYNKAYKYAKDIGLDDPSAEKIAESVTTSRRNAAIEKTKSAISAKRLTKEDAYRYAISLGLSEEDANELAEYAELRIRSNKYSLNYLDELKKKWEEEDP